MNIDFDFDDPRDWLLVQLTADGEVELEELKNAARACGHDWKTITEALETLPFAGDAETFWWSAPHLILPLEMYGLSSHPIGPHQIARAVRHVLRRLRLTEYEAKTFLAQAIAENCRHMLTLNDCAIAETNATKGYGEENWRLACNSA